MSPLPSFAVTMGPVSWTCPFGAGMYQIFWRTQIRRPDTPFMWRQYSLKAPGKAYSESSSSPDIRGHHRFLFCQAFNWAFNTTLAFAVPPGLNTMA